jgi:hypothetical protein
MRQILPALLVVPLLICAPALARAAPPPPAPPGMLEQQCGVPLGTGVVTFEVTLMLKGKAVTKTVTIPKGDIVAFVQPARMKDEKFADWVDRVAAARGEASQAKAKVFAAAINKAFGLKAPGPVVTTGTEVKSQKFFVRNMGVSFNAEADVTLGTFIIPDVAKDKTDIIKWTENKVIGEGGNGTRYIPGAPPSPGARGSLDQATPGVQTVATGEDPDGNPSVVDFGLDGKYVADFMPTKGMTDVVVLKALALLLDAHGIAATYDSSDEELLLDNPFPDGEQLDWGNTDTGLVFTTVITPLGTAIPEPALWALMAAGFGLAGGLLRRRPARPVEA